MTREEARCVSESSNCFERLVVLLQLLIVAVRELSWIRLVLIGFSDVDEPVSIRIGQGLDQCRVHDVEDRRIRANTQSNGNDRDQRVRRMLPQRTNSET